MSMQIKQQKQKGQGMVEYIIVVALIALGAIAAFSFFGQSVRGQTAQMADQVAGNLLTTGQAQSVTAAASATTSAAAKVDMATYKAQTN